MFCRTAPLNGRLPRGPRRAARPRRRGMTLRPTWSRGRSRRPRGASLLRPRVRRASRSLLPDRPRSRRPSRRSRRSPQQRRSRMIRQRVRPSLPPRSRPRRRSLQRLEHRQLPRARLRPRSLRRQSPHRQTCRCSSSTNRRRSRMRPRSRPTPRLRRRAIRRPRTRAFLLLVEAVRHARGAPSPHSSSKASVNALFGERVGVRGSGFIDRFYALTRIAIARRRRA